MATEGKYSECLGKSTYMISADIQDKLRVGGEVLTNRVVANTVRLNKALEVDGDQKNPGMPGQHLVSRGPGLSPEWSDAMPDSVPDYTDFDIAVIGAGESGVTTLIHLANICDPSKKIVLITDGPQQDKISFRQSLLTLPQNLPEGDEKDVLLQMVKDGSIIGAAQGGYNNINLGGNAYRNKLNNIYAYRWSNDSDPNKPGNPKGGFEFGSWQVKEVGGYCNINGGNAGTDPADYRVTSEDTTWNGVDTGLKEDNLDELLEIYKTYYPNLTERPVKLQPGESYPATQQTVNNFINYAARIEDALKNSALSIKDTAYSVDRENLFVSGRRNWSELLHNLQQQHPNIEIIYDTEINEVRNAGEDVKTLIGNRRQFRLLTRKVILCGGQVGTTKLVDQMIHDNLPLFNNVKPKLNYRENTGQILFLFLGNTNPELCPAEDGNYRSIVVAREMYNAAASNRQTSSTVEVQALLNFDTGYDPHLLKIFGLFSNVNFPSADAVFQFAAFEPELKGLITGFQVGAFFGGQRFLDVDKIQDMTYEPDLGLTQEQRDALYARWKDYKWENNVALDMELAKAQKAGDTKSVNEITQLLGLLRGTSANSRCIPWGWLSVTGFICYAPSKYTALLGNVGNIIEHDDTLQREFKLDPKSEWNNDRTEDENARQFRLVENLIGTKVNYRAHDVENTGLSPELLRQFKDEYVNEFKQTFKNCLKGPDSLLFNILNQTSLGQYNIFDIPEFFGPLGYVPWVADESQGFNNINNLPHSWYATEKPINFDASTDEWLLDLQQNIQTVWHASQHLHGLTDHSTNKFTALNNIWCGDQCAWHNITPSSSATLSALMGMRAAEDACRD